MQAITQTAAVGVETVLEAYDWDALGDGTVVEVSEQSQHTRQNG